MKPPTYRDLADYGLPLVTPGAAVFDALVSDIRGRPDPFGPWAPGDLDPAAVVLNRGDKAVIVLAHVWRYTFEGGQTHSSRFADLGSGLQFDVLCGRSDVVRDLATFILPGSKRLITEAGFEPFADSSRIRLHRP